MENKLKSEQVELKLLLKNMSSVAMEWCFSVNSYMVRMLLLVNSVSSGTFK